MLRFLNKTKSLNHVQWVHFHHDIMLSQVANGDDIFRMWRLTANSLTKSHGQLIRDGTIA
jgi:hypothetical protein